jgi:hypothetical protein
MKNRHVFKSITIIFVRAGRRFIQPRPVTLFGEPIQGFYTTRYLRATLGKQTWSSHIDRQKENCLKDGLLGPLLNKKSDLSVRNGILLYKQFIRPMDYACPAWRSAARTHVRRLQVLKSKCLRLATGAPWYVTGRYTRILVFRCLPTTSEPCLRALTKCQLTSERPSTATPQIR